MVIPFVFRPLESSSLKMGSLGLDFYQGGWDRAKASFGDSIRIPPPPFFVVVTLIVFVFFVVPRGIRFGEGGLGNRRRFRQFFRGGGVRGLDPGFPFLAW